MPRAATTESQQAPTILLVDDEEDIRVSFRRYLRSCMPEAKLLTAATGPEALGILEHERVDLVLSDYRMPGMDGLRFLAAAARVQPTAVRALVTAYADPALGGVERGDGTVAALLRKPIEPAEMLPILLDLIGHRSPATPA